MLTTLAAAVLFVACANVAGLLTSRAPARAREMAMRVAIGAGRGRLIRQLLTESLLIALAGGVLGLAVGYGAISVFQQIQLPTDLPVALTFQLDRRALMFSLGVAVLSAILFGLAPAIQTSRTDLAMVMKAGEAIVGTDIGDGDGACWSADRSPCRWCCWCWRRSCIAASRSN